MKFFTFLKTGVEVLHLGMQNAESNAWPIEHWRANPGRFRLFTPSIDAYLNQNLANLYCGDSVDTFVLVLEVADFKVWGNGSAFTRPSGHSSYKPKIRELRCVGKMNWPEVQMLSAKLQLQAYAAALATAISNAAHAKRKPKDFDFTLFASAVANHLQTAKVSELSWARYLMRDKA